jgi:hypothetical protein
MAELGVGGGGGRAERAEPVDGPVEDDPDVPGGDGGGQLRPGSDRDVAADSHSSSIGAMPWSGSERDP